LDAADTGVTEERRRERGSVTRNAETHGGGSRQPLTQAQIRDAALRIIDTEGLPALNMRRLGAELGVRAMALYRHLPNKQAILDGVVAHILGSIGELPSGLGARETARWFFTSFRRALAAHPNALPLAAAAAFRSGEARERAEQVVQAMHDRGLAQGDALEAFHILESFTLGFAWVELAGFIDEIPDRAPFQRRNVPPPSAGASLAPDQPDDDPRFTHSLDVVLRALLPD
jgi:AcrR family transcriptional regulator